MINKSPTDQRRRLIVDISAYLDREHGHLPVCEVRHALTHIILSTLADLAGLPLSDAVTHHINNLSEYRAHLKECGTIKH
jgi:hypothetical protein